MIIDAEELKRRYLLRIAGARDNKVYIGPEVVTVPFTNACNLRCQYCITDHAPENPAHLGETKFFSWEKFKDLVSDCVDLKVDQITVCGTGEPTVHPKFKEMIRHLEKQPLKVVLHSNATFPLEYCSEVIKVDHVVINFGASDRQHYLELHGKDLFDRVVNNIKQLVALRDAQKPSFYIEIVYIMNTLNIDQKQAMKDMESALGVNSVNCKKMTVSPFNHQIALPDNYPSDEQGEIRQTPPMCLNGWFYTVVNVDSYVSTCALIPDMKAGNIDQWGLKGYWQSSDMMETRLSGKYGQIQKKFKACQTCSLYDNNMQRAKDLSQMRKT